MDPGITGFPLHSRYLHRSTALLHAWSECPLCCADFFIASLLRIRAMPTVRPKRCPRTLREHDILPHVDRAAQVQVERVFARTVAPGALHREQLAC
jgi:hypothetical protein